MKDLFGWLLPREDKMKKEGMNNQKEEATKSKNDKKEVMNKLKNETDDNLNSKKRKREEIVENNNSKEEKSTTFDKAISSLKYESKNSTENLKTNTIDQELIIIEVEEEKEDLKEREILKPIKENKRKVGDKNNRIDKKKKKNIKEKKFEVLIVQEEEMEKVHDLREEEADVVVKEESLKDEEESDGEESEKDISLDEEQTGDGIQYEQLRLQNIQRNAEMLKSLGLQKDKQEMGFYNENKKNKGEKKAKKSLRKKITPIPEEHLRRSGRNKGGEEVEGSVSKYLDVEGVEAEKIYHNEPEIFSDSNVYRYITNDIEEGSLNNNIENDCNSVQRVLRGVKLDESHTFVDNNLKRIFSMDFNEKLLCSAGDKGHVSIYGNQLRKEEEGEVGPLLSFKAHSKWVSSVRFIKNTASHSLSYLLTSSNDSSVVLWDLEKQSAKGVPMKQTTQYNHEKGVFSLDCIDNFILTGSKDNCVVLSQLISTEISIIKRFEAHTGVVKSVHFRDREVFASGGNDLNVCVFDSRCEAPTLTFENAHSKVVNSVRWSRNDLYTICSASFDEYIKVWDIRKGSESIPLHTLTGHCQPKSKNQIYHPVFLGSGKYILTCGSGASYFTLFSLVDGKRSVGEINGYASAILVRSDDNLEKKNNISFFASISQNISIYKGVYL